MTTKRELLEEIEFTACAYEAWRIEDRGPSGPMYDQFRSAMIRLATLAGLDLRAIRGYCQEVRDKKVGDK